MAEEGSKQMKVTGLDDKPEITAVQLHSPDSFSHLNSFTLAKHGGVTLNKVFLIVGIYITA